MKKIVRMAGMLLAFALASCTQQPQETLSIIPVPLKAELQGGSFVINEQTQAWIDAPEADKQILQDFLASSPLKLVQSEVELIHNILFILAEGKAIVRT